jgi:hypothetical protein
MKITVHTVQGCIIGPCKCVSPYQDSKYGKGNRVHNMLGPRRKDTSTTMRCSVCGKSR